MAAPKLSTPKFVFKALALSPQVFLRLMIIILMLSSVFVAVVLSTDNVYVRYMVGFFILSYGTGFSILCGIRAGLMSAKATSAPALRPFVGSLNRMTGLYLSTGISFVLIVSGVAYALVVAIMLPIIAPNLIEHAKNPYTQSIEIAVGQAGPQTATAGAPTGTAQSSLPTISDPNAAIEAATAPSVVGLSDADLAAELAAQDELGLIDYDPDGNPFFEYIFLDWGGVLSTPALAEEVILPFLIVGFAALTAIGIYVSFGGVTLAANAANAVDRSPNNDIVYGLGMFFWPQFILYCLVVLLPGLAVLFFLPEVYAFSTGLFAGEGGSSGNVTFGLVAAVIGIYLACVIFSGMGLGYAQTREIKETERQEVAAPVFDRSDQPESLRSLRQQRQSGGKGTGIYVPERQRLGREGDQ